MNEITTQETKDLQQYQNKAIEYLNNMGMAKIEKKYQNQFLEMCSTFKLNPFSRDVYAIAYKDKFNIIVGFEVYLRRASESGKLAGWKAWTTGSKETKDLKGCVEIQRKDFTAPFYFEVDFDEYNTNQNLWVSKPKTMIKKVAMAQGFRLCFPEQLSGIGYTADELPEEEIQPRNVTPATQPVEKTFSDEDRKAQLEDWSMVADLAKKIVNPGKELLDEYNDFYGKIKNNQPIDIQKLRVFADKLREKIGYIDV